MLTLMIILAVAALIGAIVAMMGKCPVTVPVLILAIIAVLHVIPMG